MIKITINIADLGVCQIFAATGEKMSPTPTEERMAEIVSGVIEAVGETFHGGQTQLQGMAESKDTSKSLTASVGIFLSIAHAALKGFYRLHGVSPNADELRGVLESVTRGINGEYTDADFANDDPCETCDDRNTCANASADCGGKTESEPEDVILSKEMEDALRNALGKFGDKE